MQISGNQSISFENNRIVNLPKTMKSDGEKAAEFFKYYRQQNLGNGPGSIKRISARTLYNQHKKVFDGLAKIFLKYNLNVETYIKFFVSTLGKTERDIDKELLTILMIKQFADRLSIIEKRKKVYKWFMKSANNLADYCLEHGFSTAFDGIRDLIANRKIAAWYVGGQLSEYFIVSIPGFNKVIPRLDHFSKCELNAVLNKFDIYRTEINKVFLYFKRRKVNPYEITDNLIMEKRGSFVKKQEINMLFDPSLDEKPKNV